MILLSWLRFPFHIFLKERLSSKPDIAANAISVTIIYNQLEDTSDDNGNHSVNDDYSKLIATSALHISEATIASNQPDIAVNAILVTTIFNQLENRIDDNINHSTNDIFLHKQLNQTNLTLKKTRSITTYPLVHSTRN